MDLAQVWKQYLSNWPDGLLRKGVVVSGEEQIVFVSFLMSDAVVLFERQAPDSVGGRKVILPYDAIKAIKVTEPIDDKPFIASGFAPSLSKPQAAKRAGAAAAAARPAPAVPQKA